MTRVTLIVPITCVLTTWCTGRALAQTEPLVTDRPDQTESAAIVEPGAAQFELGWMLRQDETFDFRTREHALLGALARIGLTERLEARVGFAGWMAQDNQPPTGPSFDRSGIGDLDVGFKYKVAEGGTRRPEMAVIGTVALPTGETPFQRLRADPAVRLAFANELSDRVGVGYNVGLEWNTDCDPNVADACSEKTFTDALYTVAFGFALAERVGAFLEGFGTIPLDIGGGTAHSLDGGFTFLARDNVQLDVSGGVGLNDGADDWFLGAGVAVRIPR